MSWKPSFILYASDGSTPVYTFEHIQETNWPIDNPSFIEHTNLRSSGSILVPGGDKAYDLILNGVLTADDYSALTTKIFALRDTVLANTRYVLKLEKSDGVYDTINVQRVSPIILEPSRRINIQKYQITFKALSWA